MSRIVLISLRSPFMDSDRVFPPLGAMQLKACLDAAGHDCVLDDAPDFDDVDRYRGFDVLGFSVMTPQGREAREALLSLKAAGVGGKFVVGGPHALHYRDACEPDPWDHIVTGDGERFFTRIANGEAGLDRVLHEAMSEDEMNATPRPWRDREWLGKYQWRLDGLPGTTMLTTRGCPMGCRFCEDARTKVRHYRPERIRAEIEDVMAAGFGAVMFFDDIFAMIPKRTTELTRMIAPYGLKYRCFAHANTLKENMAAELAASGCVEVGFGCEHASQKMLDTIGKGVKVAHNEEFLDRCARHGIRVKAFFIAGLPGETEETLAELEAFIARHTASGLLYDFDLSVYFPYRGTEFRDNMPKYDLSAEGDLDAALGYYKGKGGDAEVTLRTAALTGAQIRAAKDRIYHAHNRRFKAPAAVACSS